MDYPDPRSLFIHTFCDRRHFLLASLLFAIRFEGQAPRPAVEFPASGLPAAHAAFIKGVIALHNASYEDAAEYFQAAQKIDAGFVMAYWGEAMTFNHPFWAEQDIAAGRRALAKLAPTRAARAARAKTGREREYLNAVEILYGEGDKDSRDSQFAAAMAALAAHNPGDVEAALFYTLALHGTLRVRDHSYATETKIAGILQPILQKHPDHPGALHYLIHAYDDPAHAALGLPAARRYERVAGDSPHALHMSSHIYIQLGMWADAARANQAAFDASDRRMKSKGLTAASRDYHSLEWLMYAEIQSGQYRKARGHADLMLQSAQQAGVRGMTGVAAIFAARFAVETDQWDILLPYPQVNRTPELLFAQGMASLHKNDPAGGRRAIAALDALSSEIKTRLPLKNELEALLAVAEKRFPDARRLAGEAVKYEAAMEFPSGPPDLVKPAYELYGEILLAMNQPAEAAEQFSVSLKRMPGRTQSLLGLARSRALTKNLAGAAAAYRELAKIWVSADPDLAAVREVRLAVSR